MRNLVFAFLLITSITSSSSLACDSCSTGEQIKELPPTCLSEVELIVENSVAYPPNPENLKKVLPFVRQANRAAYRCSHYDIAVGKDLTVIVDRDTGTIYLTRYIFQPEER